MCRPLATSICRSRPNLFTTLFIMTGALRVSISLLMFDVDCIIPKSLNSESALVFFVSSFLISSCVLRIYIGVVCMT